MTTLDTRARKAAAAIHHSVAEFTPTVTAADLARRGAWHRGLNFAGALAVIVLAVVVGSLLRSAIERDEVADTLPPEPVVTTTIAAVDEPIVETGLPDIVVPTDPDAEPADPVVPVREDGGDARTPVTVPPPVDEPPVVDEVDTEPPLIEITSPEDGATFEEKIVRFAGRTEPGATVAAGKYDADVTEDGVWGITLVLSPGGNRATFIATDAAGNTATASITVYYEPPPPPEPPKEFEFTAFATYGSCELGPSLRRLLRDGEAGGEGDRLLRVRGRSRRGRRRGPLGDQGILPGGAIRQDDPREGEGLERSFQELRVHVSRRRGCVAGRLQRVFRMSGLVSDRRAISSNPARRNMEARPIQA